MPAPLCPDCRLPLSTARLGPVTVHACRSCGGAWFPDGALRSIAAAGDAVVRKLAEHLRAGRNAVPPPPASVAECPQCGQPLLSNPSATLTGVEVRACIPCKGHWAPMRALQILASQLTPRTRREDAPSSPQPAPGRKAAPMPSWKVTGPCPRCLGDRQTIECGDQAVEVCGDCGGAWIPQNAREALCASTAGARSGLLAQIRRVRTGKHRQPQRQLLCPDCVVEMRASEAAMPACSRCSSLFVDFYALPQFLDLTAVCAPVSTACSVPAFAATDS